MLDRIHQNQSHILKRRAVNRIRQVETEVVSSCSFGRPWIPNEFIYVRRFHYHYRQGNFGRVVTHARKGKSALPVRGHVDAAQRRMHARGPQFQLAGEGRLSQFSRLVYSRADHQNLMCEKAVTILF